MRTHTRNGKTDNQPRPWKLVVICALSGLACAVALMFSGWTLATQTNENSDAGDMNCQRIHQLVKTLDTIMASGDEQIRRYVAEGTLTPEQGARADAERAKQRRVLSTADCPPSE
jgi:hypothetical protein